MKDETIDNQETPPEEPQVQNQKPNLSEAGNQDNLNLEAVYDIPVNITVLLGSAKMTVNQLLKLGKGSVVELDKGVGDPVEVFVNNRLVAKGEVVIVEDKVGITLTEIPKDITSL